MLKNKPFWFSLALVAIYLLLAYFAVPPLLQPRLEQYIGDQLGRELRFEKLQFDPITWTAQLSQVRSGAAEQGLFPDVVMTADAIHLRFNFWRLKMAISEMQIQAPVLIIDDRGAAMQSGRYPFVSLWQQWQSSHGEAAGSNFITISHWRLDAGRLMLVDEQTPGTEFVLLDKVFWKSGKLNAAGVREFSLDFSTAEQHEIKLQGLLDPVALSSTGRFQLRGTNPQQRKFLHPQTLADASVEVQAEGAFKTTSQSDALLIDLADSQLSADSAAKCLLNELLCAAIYPVQASFEATLVAATDGIQLLSADARLAAFRMDSFLAQGSLELGHEMSFASARIVLATPAKPLATRDRSPGVRSQDIALDIDLELQSVTGLSYQAEGKFYPQTEQAELRFSSSGSVDTRGELRWLGFAAQNAEAAYSQLELQLENPAASLAQNFMQEHLSGEVAAGSMQLRFIATQTDAGVSMQENISLQQVRVLPDAGPPKRLTLDLDSNWLLALLQNPQSEVKLEFTEEKLAGTERINLKTWLQAPILPYLASLAERPFMGLARQMGREELDLAQVEFAAGSAELTDDSSEILKVLADALLQRPGLGIEMAGVFDPLIDKKALQTEQVRTHIALASAAELAFRSGSEPPDFNDPVVHSVIDEFARRRLPAKVLSAFTDHFGQADVDHGVIPEGDVAAYYSALFELLVDYADIPQAALGTLARYRAQAVSAELEGQGVAAERLLTLAQAQSSAAELSGVPLMLTLRIKADSKPELPQSSSPDFESL